MEWSTISLIGNREINEDSLDIITYSDGGCFVIADGLGGHGKGDIASAAAVHAFAESFREKETPLAETMDSAFLRAQTDILSLQKQSGNLYQMKTTLCALAVRGNKLIWGHIGDSRLYAFAHNRIKFRTMDHSVPQMLVLTKEIKEKEIRNHPDRNKLLRVLGVADDVPKYEICEEKKLDAFQAFLLCSDGFWELILEKEMCSLLKKSHSVDEWLKKMQVIIETRGATHDMDNCSAIAVWI